MDQSKITQVFGITPEELKESILIDVRAEFKSLAQNFQPINPPEYITRQEVSKILQVSLVTLSDWNKKKILNPYRLGNLIRYKRSEIDQALIRINS
nr:helix-turn-helix domain-containing protein [uncultured Flavobacterium sp.]